MEALRRNMRTCGGRRGGAIRRRPRASTDRGDGDGAAVGGERRTEAERLEHGEAVLGQGDAGPDGARLRDLRARVTRARRAREQEAVAAPPVAPPTTRTWSCEMFMATTMDRRGHGRMTAAAALWLVRQPPTMRRGWRALGPGRR